MVIIRIRLVGEPEDRFFSGIILESQVSSIDLKKRIESVTKVALDFQEIQFHGEELPYTLYPLESVNDYDELVVKHSMLHEWVYYKECVESVLKNKNLPNRNDLVQSASSINKNLSVSNFFDVYLTFLEYRNRNHWRIIKYLDTETSLIAVAAREHFAVLNNLKGGSENDFHFEFVPKDSHGTRSGIISLVHLGVEKEKTKWQVKAHHHGVSTFSSEITGPDIRELFCYKLFELIGVGPEVRFIMPSKDLGSKTAVYVGTRWREDFDHLSENESNEDIKEALVQLHLLQVLLCVEDLHGLNCGTWKETRTAAIVDFCMGVERKDSKKLFLQRYNSKLAWDDQPKELFENTSRSDRLQIAKKWLEKWNFCQNIDQSDSFMSKVKVILKNDCATKFRGYDTDEDNECYNAQVTDDLKSYIDMVKSNVKAILE